MPQLERKREREEERKGGKEEGRKKRSCMLHLRGPHVQQLGLGAAKYIYELKKQKDGVMRASDFSRKTRNCDFNMQSPVSKYWQLIQFFIKIFMNSV